MIAQVIMINNSNDDVTVILKKYSNFMKKQDASPSKFY